MLRGIVPPLVTPLSGRDELDQPGLEKLVAHIVDGGVHGVFALGTTGEAPSLSYRVRRELIDRVITLVAGRVPVLVGITDTSFVESLALARHAAEAGAWGVVLATPFLCDVMSQIAMNHLRSGILLSSKIVPTLMLKRFRQSPHL